MKKFLIGFAVFAIVAFAGLAYFKHYTKSFSPAATARYQKDGAAVEINYCRPSAKGRLIFGEKSAGALVPFGEYWRLGANEATVFATNVPLLVGGKELAPGRYAMYAYPGQANWTIAFNSDWNRWGATEPDEKKDVLRVEVPASTAAAKKEMLEITFDEPDSSGAAHADIQWDKTQVRVPFAKK